MLEVKVKTGVLPLETAFALVSGDIKTDDLTAEQKSFVHESSDGICRVTLENGGKYALGQSSVTITQPCLVEGNGAQISCEAEFSMIVTVSNVTVDHVEFRKHNIAVKIVPQGRVMEHVHFTNCVFAEMATYGVVAGCDKSDGLIRDLMFDGCTFIGKENTETFSDVSGVYFLNLAAALGDDTCDVSNCVLDGVSITNCRAYGGHRDFANVWPCYLLSGLGQPKHKFCNNEVKNVKFLHNDLSDCMDPYLMLLAGTAGRFDCSVHDVEVAYNNMKVGLWSVYITACEPIFGAASGGRVYDVSIHDNEISVYEGGVGEASMGVAIQVGRIDYFGGTHASDAVVENISVCNNTFRGMTRGIYVSAACALFDGEDNIIENCVGRNILIEGNKFYDVEELFDIWASNHEGRRLDWNIGVPPHEVVWGELLEDKEIVTVQTRNNRLENIVIRNNFASGYRYKYRLNGVKALGQGIASGNVCQVVLENNHFEHGEGHYCVRDFDAYDNVRDGGDNKVIISGNV